MADARRSAEHRRRAYIIFTEANAASGVLDLSRWREHRRTIVNAERDSDDIAVGSSTTVRSWTRRSSPETTDDATIVWRLFSTHHRELGCSAEVFPTFAAASERAQTAVVQLPKLRLRRVGLDDGGAFSWFALLSGVPLLMANRWWSSSRERDDQLLAVQRALRGVDVAPSLLDVGRGSIAIRTRPVSLEGPRDDAQPVPTRIRELASRDRQPTPRGRRHPE